MKLNFLHKFSYKILLMHSMIMKGFRLWYKCPFNLASESTTSSLPK